MADAEWALLCEEFQAAQERTLAAMRAAFRSGRFASAEAMQKITEAEAAVDEIRRRMDEFIAAAR